MTRRHRWLRAAVLLTLIALALLAGCTEQMDSERTVWVAPISGERWHATPDCWGLAHARQVRRMTLAEAERRGFTPCKLCGEQLDAAGVTEREMTREVHGRCLHRARVYRMRCAHNASCWLTMTAGSVRSWV